jgi:hypothetical protein
MTRPRARGEITDGDRVTAPPGNQMLGATVVALEEQGFNLEIVNDFVAVLARISCHPMT